MEKIPATNKLGAPGTSPDMSFFDIKVGPRGPYEVTVTADDLARWARIYEDANPLYGGSRPGRQVAPPSILYYPSQSMLGRYLIGKSPNATLPGGFARYSMECLAPIPVGKPLKVTGEVFDKFARRGRGFVYYRLEAECEGTIVQRHWKSWAFGLTDDEAAQFPQRTSDPRDDVVGEPTEELGPLELDITLARMADLEGPGERNAHTDVEAARQSGGGRPLAQGAISFGLISRMMADRFGEGYLRGGSLDVRFLDRVFAGDTLFARGELVRSEDGKALLRVWAERQDGARVTVGTASARI